MKFPIGEVAPPGSSGSISPSASNTRIQEPVQPSISTRPCSKMNTSPAPALAQLPLTVMLAITPLAKRTASTLLMSTGVPW